MKYTPLPPEQLEHLILRFSWTTSRAPDTYGYNICTLRSGRTGDLISRCSGGGYDMSGTCFGDWIQLQFQKELIDLAGRVALKPYGTSNCHSLEGFYGAVAHSKDGKVIRVSLDGACGFMSMETILHELGWAVRFSGETKKDKFYLLVKEAQ